MRTTININDALLEELKRRSRGSGRTMTEVVNEMLNRGLSVKPPRSRPVRLRTFKVGIKAAYRGMSLNQLYDQVEAEDVPKVAEE